MRNHVGARLGGGATATFAVLILALGLSPGEAEAQEEERLSPLDSATATIEGAELAVQYGRPSMRGREIFGGLVPYDELWRTGANEATHFRSTADLKLGETTLPAGHYTLWTIPGEEGWTLIVNSETGQWGTQHDESQDVESLPMRVEKLESAVDTFTIRLKPADEHDGILAMEWENTRAWVPIEVLGEER